MYAIKRHVLCTLPLAVLVCGSVAFATDSRETAAQQQSDTELVQSVKQALHADKTLLARHINVRAENGTVTLSGHVPSPEELLQAERDAKAVPGVMKVTDRMQIERGAVGNAGTSP